MASGQAAPHAWEKSYPENLDWHAEIPPSTLPALFDESVKKYADRVCLNFMGEKLTYKEVGAMVDSFARGLQEQGIGKGAKVGLCLPNSPFYVIAYYAALKAGATVVNFNPLYAAHEMEHQIRDSDADMMVTLDLAQVYPKVGRMLGEARLKKIVVCDMADILPAKKAFGFRAFNRLSRMAHARPLKALFNDYAGRKIDALGKKIGVQSAVRVKKDASHLRFSDLVKTKGRPAPAAVSPDDVAVLQYTGGTTGVPKAAVLSQGNLAANVRQAALWFLAGEQREKQDKILAVLPFFHVFSMTAQMNLSLYTGAELVMLPKFELKEFLETVTREKPTIFAGVPDLYKKIVEAPDLGKYDLSSLQVCISGAAPLTDEVRAGFKKATGIELLEGYGSSECSAAAVANPVRGVKKPKSIGMPLPGTEVKILPLEDYREAGKAVGEICLRGPQVMQGYWKKPDETAGVMEKDGFMRTGDVGYVDEDGYVFIVGRSKDMIILNGLKIFPLKVESAILKHEAVKDVSVIGVKNAKTGEAPKAFIVLKEGKTLADGELQKFLAGYLAPYEIPRLVEYRANLPLTAIGKPDKKALKKEEEAKAAHAAARPQPKI
ncbi:MAG: long-chain fatty acid--CoA ligase [Alphaproteobacteria bacterium]|nr:long-chain fatty acid--CoA ligase [Alphaproteobacteria bacterium]MDE2337438.1 long-chain fatty acid--CoA ligase [Alphaproteobacteria bacterium]